MATLCAIIQISSNDYWLMSDGGYRKGSSICSRFCDIKPLCTVTEPSMTPVKDDFANVIKNLHAIVMKCATPGYEQGKGFFFYDNSTTNPSRFKVHHKLFEWLEHNETDKNVLESLMPLKPVRNYIYWKPHSHLIPPAAYQQSLENAIVKLQFNLCHWPITSKLGTAAFNSYTADIVPIRVLIPPPPPINNDFHKKRKIFLFLDPDSAITPCTKKKK
ncbi:hypothetical protein BKA83DRAFT_4481247 [Pisolithus microcarpus]|nr:hypothetical protein BKA83DRAFT_4481247 [Pisolithus microcarpus]